MHNGIIHILYFMYHTHDIINCKFQRSINCKRFIPQFVSCLLTREDVKKKKKQNKTKQKQVVGPICMVRHPLPGWYNS